MLIVIQVTHSYFLPYYGCKALTFRKSEVAGQVALHPNSWICYPVREYVEGKIKGYT